MYGRLFQYPWHLLAALGAAWVINSVSLAAALASDDDPGPPRQRDDGLSVATPASVGLDSGPLVALRKAIEHGEFPKTTSVLIMRDGKLVYEAYFNGGDYETLNDTRSATKSVTGLGIGAAIADGLIGSVDEPAFNFLSDLKPFAHDEPLKAGVTLADLLTMSSALECDDDVEGSAGNEDNMHLQPVWTRWAVDLPVKAAYQRDATGRGPFAYCTAGAFLLGQVLQRVAKMPVDRYIETRLLAPLGIRRFVWPRSPAGEVMTGGGLQLTSRDLARIAWMVLAGGRWAQQQVLPTAWTDAATTIHRRANAELDYGYLFWHRVYGSPCNQSSAWFMAGNGGNAILQFKDQRAVVVVTRQNYNTRGMHQETVRLVQDYVLKAFACSSK